MSLTDNWTENFTVARNAIEATNVFRMSHTQMPEGVLHHPAADTYAYVALLAIQAEEANAQAPKVVIHECGITGEEIARRLFRYLRGSHGKTQLG